MKSLAEHFENPVECSVGRIIPKPYQVLIVRMGVNPGMAGFSHSALRIRLNSSQVATSESGGDSSCSFSLQLSASLSIKGWTPFSSEILTYVVL